MANPTKHVFYPVRCTNKKCSCQKYIKSRGSKNTEPIWLGEIQVDTPNISKHRCHLCNTTYRHTVHANLAITREVSKEQTVITETLARFEG